MSGFDAQEQHCSETGHSNFELHIEDNAETLQSSSDDVGMQAIAVRDTLTSRVTLPKKAWIKLAEIQSYYGLNNMNKALTKAINLAHENIEKERSA